MAKVLIGIQARSTSERLPRKSSALIGERPMIERVIESCEVASRHIARKHKVDTVVALLTPTGDPLAHQYRKRCQVVEGPEHDVLARYELARRKFLPDYIVRITGDCPLIPPYIIDNLTGVAIQRGYDYFSNVDEECRTAIDGLDCEVISNKLLIYADLSATEPLDREHVTTFLRRDRLKEAKYGVAVNFFDFSHLKYSVDTEEDLKRVRDVCDRAQQKYITAVEIFGRENVHRL